ncbi:hypothetical protein DRJ17_07175, partial [Candidatus Woesearchaeota archaeon]
MVDVVIAHPSLNRGGGAERVCLSFIEVLINAGYRVKLVTLDKTDWKMLEGRFGEVSRPNEETYFMSAISNLGMSSQAAITASFFPLTLLLLRHKRKSLLINTYGDLVDCIADLAYVNAIPIRLSYKVSFTFPQPSWQVFTRIYNGAPFWRFAYKSLLVANSKFIQEVLLKKLRRNSIVVHPPVDVNIFMKNSHYRKKHEDLIVAVARLRLGKRLDIIPKVASLVKDAKFILLTIADKASKTAMRRITALIKHFRVNDRVKLMVNQSFEDYLNVLSSASLYFHTQPSEAFGISVVEAMASGCVPIVPCCG